MTVVRAGGGLAGGVDWSGGSEVLVVRAVASVDSISFTVTLVSERSHRSDG